MQPCWKAELPPGPPAHPQLTGVQTRESTVAVGTGEPRTRRHRPRHLSRRSATRHGGSPRRQPESKAMIIDSESPFRPPHLRMRALRWRWEDGRLGMNWGSHSLCLWSLSAASTLMLACVARASAGVPEALMVTAPLMARWGSSGPGTCDS